MKIKLASSNDDVFIDGEIIEVKNKNLLPSIQDGWRFDFRKNAKKIAGARCFTIVDNEIPNETQGCIIYMMRDKREPYLAYIEIAPHNRNENRKYSNITGCLIAFACKLSFEIDDLVFKGWLAFDVIEENEKDSQKLMSVYSSRYKAKRIADTTTMIIEPKDGIKLIAEYLNR